MIVRSLRSVLAVTSLVACGMAQLGVTPPVDIQLQLPADGHEIAFDEARDRYYVSVPDSNAILVVSASNHQVVTTIPIAPRPRGMDISHDGSTLYVAMQQGSGIALIDLDTLQLTETLNLGTLLDHPNAWDVCEAKPGWVFVSANPGSSGFAYIVLVRRDQANAATRVASNRIIRAGPKFHKDPTGQFLYVGEGFSPNSLYKLDLSQPTAPIVAEDNHGTLSGTQEATVNAAGTRIFLRSGQIVDTTDLTPVGLIGSGFSRLNASGNTAYVMTSNQLLEVYDTKTQLPTSSVVMPCPPSTIFPNVTDLWVDGAGTNALAIVDDMLCGVTTAPVPLVDAVRPNRARFDAGPTSVTVTGAYFMSAGSPAVTVGGVAATNVVVVDDTTLTCTIPQGDPGAKDVDVTTANGTTTFVDGFSHTPTMQVRGDLTVNGQCDVRVLLSPGDMMFFMGSINASLPQTYPGSFGTLYLNEPVVLLSVPFWPTDGIDIGIPVPDDPLIRGFEAHLQSLTITPVSGGGPVSVFTDLHQVRIQ
jgi:hypothetical protein